LKLTEVNPTKFVPVITTEVPTGPVDGVKSVIPGEGSVTVKSVLLVAVPALFVTVTFPVVDPVGTVAVICVSLSTI